MFASGVFLGEDSTSVLCCVKLVSSTALSCELLPGTSWVFMLDRGGHDPSELSVVSGTSSGITGLSKVVFCKDASSDNCSEGFTTSAAESMAVSDLTISSVSTRGRFS